MKSIFTAFLLLLSTQTFAQGDTVTVQTLTLDSDTRNGVFEFPDDPNASYRKVIMEYTMRCINGEVNPGDNSTGCHEWDYSCNTFITDSTTVDSLMATHPTHIISNFDEDVFPYTTQPTYTHYQSVQKQVSYNNVLSETETQIGAGSEVLDHPFSSEVPYSKTQYLWDGLSLIADELEAGDITSIKLELSEPIAAASFLRIKMKLTDQDFLTTENIEADGFTEVFYLDKALDNNITQFKFHTPFNWDGMSGILMEISYQNENELAAVKPLGFDFDVDCSLSSKKLDRYVQFNGAESISVPTGPMSNISEEITIMFWSNGNADILPINTYIFEGVDNNRLRQASVHLPWSDGNIYWDCGNDGSGYDRISVGASPADFAGKWSHWTFTKNATTGRMSIYLDGNLIQSGTGKIKPIDITDFTIGASQAKITNYVGGVNEFTVWNKELNANTINEWMLKDLESSHPDYDNLVAYYKMDGTNSEIVMDASTFGMEATVTGALARRDMKGSDLYRNFELGTKRPNVTFVQGTYDTSIEEIVVTESVLNPQHAIRSFFVDGTDLFEDETIYVWLAADEKTFDEDGNVVSSNPIAMENSISPGTLDYFRKFPSKYELLSFVTPYGFFLDLGPNGKTWTFDVTDFLPILKGNRRLSMERGGQFNEELDIKFKFIKGTPTREVISIQNIWPFASGGYTAITEDNIFEERSIDLNPNGSSFKVRSSITGHGQNGEFIPRSHFFNINQGSTEYVWNVWKYCGQNPVYPQGGTWVFDRAGWCPGMPTDLAEMEITEFITPGETATFDYGIMEALDQSASNYLVSNQLVTYGPYNHQVDAEIMTIKRPSKDVRYARENPACIDPLIEIKNLGQENLTSLNIEYSIKGGSKLSYQWLGNLAFNETAEVVLPTWDFSFFQFAESNIFEVSISNPNGQADENQDNNVLAVEFEETVKYPQADMTFVIRTNNRAAENRLTVKDQSGSIVFERSNMTNTTSYFDNLSLMTGCYTIDFTDSGNDGLDFWYWEAVGQNVGTGYFQLRVDNQLVKTFEPDFGGDISFNFFVDAIVSNEEVLKNKILSVYPNPNNGQFEVELQGYEGEEISIEVTDMSGKLISIYNFENVADHIKKPIDISKQPNGMYLVNILSKDGVKVSKIVKGE